MLLIINLIRFSYAEPSGSTRSIDYNSHFLHLTKALWKIVKKLVECFTLLMLHQMNDTHLRVSA